MDRLENIEKIMEKLAISQAQTDAQIAETDAQIARTDAQLAKTDAQLAETHEEVKRVAKLVGGIGNSHGEIAEEFFYNSMKAKKVLNHIHYDAVLKNITKTKGDIEDEYDIFMVNGRDIAIIEVKYKAHKSDVDDLLHRKYENFKKLFPEYHNFKHHLALASFKVRDDVKKQARKQGVMVLQRRGDVFETCVPEVND